MRRRIHTPQLLCGMLLGLVLAASAPGAQSADTSQSAKIDAIGKVMAGQTPFGMTDSAPARETGPGKAVGQNIGGAILRVITGLGITIVLIIALGWGARKLGITGKPKMSAGSMDLLETLPLGQNRGVVLVRVLDRVFLLGQTSEAITALETFEGEKALEIISSARGSGSIRQFREVFTSFMHKGRKSL